MGTRKTQTTKPTALKATTSKVKRAARLGCFPLTPAAKALHAELGRLYNAAYRTRNAPAENAPRAAWRAWLKRKDAARVAFDAGVHAALERYGRFISTGNEPTHRPYFRPRQRLSLAEIVELAVIGEFSLAADHAAASAIRRAAGLRL